MKDPGRLLAFAAGCITVAAGAWIVVDVNAQSDQGDAIHVCVARDRVMRLAQSSQCAPGDEDLYFSRAGASAVAPRYDSITDADLTGAAAAHAASGRAATMVVMPHDPAGGYRSVLIQFSSRRSLAIARALAASRRHRERAGAGRLAEPQTVRRRASLAGGLQAARRG